MALWFKDWFEVDYSNEIADLEQRILKLEKSKISDTYFSNWFLKKIFFFIKRENTPQDNAAIDRNILRLEKQIKAIIVTHYPNTIFSLFFLKFN